MLLITSTWSSSPSFRMIPVSDDCPYNEAIFAIGENTLAIIGKDKKQAFQMLPKLSPTGDYEKSKQPRENGSRVCEKREIIEAYYEYYITDHSEIEQFINLFAVNSDSFDWKKFIPAPETQSAKAA